MIEAIHNSEFTPARWEKHNGRWKCVVSPNGEKVDRIVMRDTEDGERLHKLLDARAGVTSPSKGRGKGADNIRRRHGSAEPASKTT